jgi:RNA polymerase sigma-70 factor (ECF subfamily)
VEDAELVERARSGDQAAFGALVRRYSADALRLATVIACRDDDAEDAAQRAFVKAYGAMGRFRPGAPFRPWLLRIVANEAKNSRRAAGRRAALADRVGIALVPASPSAEEAALRGLDAERLLDALARLDDRDRCVIAYRWFAQMSESEMAAALDCAPGTVKSRLSRAMDRLRARLEEVTADA